MADYHFRAIEQKWQQIWEQHQTFRADNTSSQPKYYVLDMFPYPSGAGLHVGHPLGYIASDIVTRYKRNKGFNVLHPMGFDAFGLPAEQYAVQTGQHPAVTTEQNITRYKEQLRQLGLSFDWSREFRTSEPDYYKWTQWIFLQFFHSWYNLAADKAEPIASLVKHFESGGTALVQAVRDEEARDFSALEWKTMTDEERQRELLHYRLAYMADTTVNWCPQLGTVLANEEVKDGLSERGGYPVEKKKMQQWSLRITAYADRLLQGLEPIDWPEPIKEMQRNWIGKSTGAEIDFRIEYTDLKLTVFTTRPDTIFGVTYLSIAPEHELALRITRDEYKAEVQQYIDYATNRSERDRMSDVKTMSGVFTGAHATHPFTGEQLPIWIADYVLGGYGTGAVMAVPGHDSRDWLFAHKFSLPIKEVVAGGNIDEAAYDEKTGTLVNSDFLNGLDVPEAIQLCIRELEKQGHGSGKINYRLRDAICSRQRYWGEPIPIYYVNGLPQALPEEELPLLLPEIDKYQPTETGEPPLGRAEGWLYKGQYPYELSTMPGWAGSSWYYLRYMDPHNPHRLVGADAEAYWGSVDLYMGGAEHATGHLLYARFWYEFLKDRGFVTHDAPFRKLINQGMIQGRSNFVYRLSGTNTFISAGLREEHDVTPLHVDVAMVQNDVLDLAAFKQWRPETAEAEFVLEDGKYICGFEIEKMSKSKHNVVNPDDIVNDYGADTLRLYEMFLGPLEQSKPWNTNGIEGVHKFLRRFWRLFHTERGDWAVTDEAPTPAELKVLHKTIKKVEDDIERFSFNTSVSSFMICVNELTALGTRKRAILEPLTVVLSPFAPHLAEELWQLLGHDSTISRAPFPQWQEQYLVEDSFEYPVSVNGKTRAKMAFSTSASREEIEQAVIRAEEMQRYFEGKTPKKVIVVPNKIVNVVV